MTGTTIYSKGELVYPGPVRRALSAMVAALFRPGAVQRHAPMGDSDGKTLPDNEPGTIWTGPVVDDGTEYRAWCLRNGIAPPLTDAERDEARERAGRRAMAATQASRDAHHEAVKAEALNAIGDPLIPVNCHCPPGPRCIDGTPRCGTAGSIFATEPEEPTASMTGLVGAVAAEALGYGEPPEARTGPFSGPGLVGKPDCPECGGERTRHAEVHAVECSRRPRLRDTERSELAARAEAQALNAAAPLRDPVAEFAKRHPGPLDLPRYEREAIQAAADRKGITFEQAREFLANGREIACIRCGNGPCVSTPGDSLDCRLRTETTGGAILQAAQSPLMGGIGHYDTDWQRKAIEAAQTIAVEHRVIAHRVESERERRERLLAEWTAHREAAPLQPGRVPGEPMPRDERELIEQAALLAGPDHARDEQTWALLFSMALTYCQQERRPFYEEHDGNRLVHSMVRSARGMGQ